MHYKGLIKVTRLGIAMLSPLIYRFISIARLFFAASSGSMALPGHGANNRNTELMTSGFPNFYHSNFLILEISLLKTWRNIRLLVELYERVKIDVPDNKSSWRENRFWRRD
jgi:hypothetical protein